MQPDNKVAQVVLENCVSFRGTPDIILADKDSGFVGSGPTRFCNEETPLYRRLFHDAIRARELLKGDICILMTLRYR